MLVLWPSEFDDVVCVLFAEPNRQLLHPHEGGELVSSHQGGEEEGRDPRPHSATSSRRQQVTSAEALTSLLSLPLSQLLPLPPSFSSLHRGTILLGNAIVFPHLSTQNRCDSLTKHQDSNHGTPS